MEGYMFYDIIYGERNIEYATGAINTLEDAKKEFKNLVKDKYDYVILRRIDYDLFNEEITIITEHHRK